MSMGEGYLRYEGWRVVAACGIGVFCATLPLNVFGVFLKPLCDQFGWSREAASSAFGALTMIASLSAPWLGSLIDRVGPRRVIVPCLVLSGCAVVSLSRMSDTLWHLYAVFGLLGFATMGASPIAYSRAVYGWFDTRRGLAFGLVITGAALSSIVLPPFAHTLIDRIGWRLAWSALGAITLLIAVPATAGFVRDRATAQPGSEEGESGVSIRAAARSRVFWTLVLVTFGGTIAATGALVHTVALLVDRGVPPGQAAFAVSAMGGASLVGRILTGWLLDRLPPVRVSVALLVIVGLGTFILANAHSFAAGFLAALCIGFGSGGEADITPYLLSRFFGLRSLSTLYGFHWTAWGLAGVVGPVLMGRSFDATGSYAMALMELGILTFASAGLMATFPSLAIAQSRKLEVRAES